MTWVAVGMTALGVVQGDKNERKAIKDQEYKAELMKYAPYSNMAAQIAGQETKAGPDSLTYGLQGGANGIAANNAASKSGGWGKIFGGGEAQSPEAAAITKMQPGMGPDGKPMSLEEQHKWNLFAQQQTGHLNA